MSVERQIVVRFAVDGIEATQVNRFEAHHEAGRPPVFEIDTIFTNYLELDELLGQNAGLAFQFGDEQPRRLSGIVEEAMVVGTVALGAEERAFSYVFRVVSPLAPLERVVDSRIF